MIHTEEIQFPDERKDVRRDRRIAANFQRNEEFEHMARMAEEGHALTPAQRIAVGIYNNEKRIARAHGRKEI